MRGTCTEGGQSESALISSMKVLTLLGAWIEPFDMAYERIGRVYIQEGQFEEAEKVIRKATWINFYGTDHG